MISQAFILYDDKVLMVRQHVERGDTEVMVKEGVIVTIKDLLPYDWRDK